MKNNKIVKLSSIKGSLQVFNVLICHGNISRVKYSSLLIIDKVAVVRHSLGYRENVLKSFKASVASTNPENSISDLFYVIQVFFLLVNYLNSKIVFSTIFISIGLDTWAFMPASKAS